MAETLSAHMLIQGLQSLFRRLLRGKARPFEVLSIQGVFGMPQIFFRLSQPIAHPTRHNPLPS
jgi:hypothetical protein